MDHYPHQFHLEIALRLHHPYYLDRFQADHRNQDRLLLGGQTLQTDFDLLADPKHFQSFFRLAFLETRAKYLKHFERLLVIRDLSLNFELKTLLQQKEGHRIFP